jgi:hypothetical protein
MMLGIVVLLAAYVFVALLLLNLGLRSPWPWSVKAGAIVVAALFYVGSWYGLQRITGWPSSQAPPDKMRIIASEVREPDEAAGIEGAVFVWVVPLGDPKAQPRAYRFAYSPDLHDRITEAHKLEALGRKLAAERVDLDGGGYSLEFVDLPQRRLPEKSRTR